MVCSLHNMSIGNETPEALLMLIINDYGSVHKWQYSFKRLNHNCVYVTIDLNNTSYWNPLVKMKLISIIIMTLNSRRGKGLLRVVL